MKILRNLFKKNFKDFLEHFRNIVNPFRSLKLNFLKNSSNKKIKERKK